MPIIKLSQVEKRRILIFIVCLLCAMGAWMFMALNNKYVYTAKTVLFYKNIPQKRAFHPLQSDTVDLMIEGTGWQLVFARLRLKPQSINLSLLELNQRNYTVISQQLFNINKGLESSQTVISVRPDTLYFDFTPRTTKRVPLKMIEKLSFVKQYGISGNIVMNPSYITVSGPKEELDKIHSWNTDTLSLNMVQSSISGRFAVQASKQKNLSVFPSMVDVKIPVEEFTEKAIEVPIKILNNHQYRNVKLFPKKAVVKFMVPLSAYAQVNESLIEASVDLEQWSVNHQHQLMVNVTRFPSFCKLINVKPSSIDFIIER